MKKPKISDDTMLRHLREHAAETGWMPTIRELRKRCGAGCDRTVLRSLRRLEEAGRIERERGARAIKILEEVEG